MLFRRKRTPARERFSHFMAGLVLLVHAYEKFEAGHTHAGIAFVVFGSAFILYGILHTRLHGLAVAPHLETAASVIEGTALVITAGTMMHAHHKALPGCYLFAACIYFAKAYYFHRKNRRTALTESHEPAH